MCCQPPGMGQLAGVLTAITRLENGIANLTQENQKMAKENQKMDKLIEGLTKENQKMAKENQKMAKENQKMDKLIEGLTKEDQKMNALIEGLTKENEGLTKDIAKLSDELSVEKKCRGEELDAIRQVCCNSVLCVLIILLISVIVQLTLLITPIQLRVLLDLTRQQMLKTLKYETWEDLRRNRFVSELSSDIYQLLSQISQRPSYETIEFVCSYNNIRRDGNAAAHQATQEEMREAVTTKRVETKERRCLEEMYLYVFGMEV